jgi:hypothetical protein
MEPVWSLQKALENDWTVLERRWGKDLDRQGACTSMRVVLSIKLGIAISNEM